MRQEVPACFIRTTGDDVIPGFGEEARDIGEYYSRRMVVQVELPPT